MLKRIRKILLGTKRPEVNQGILKFTATEVVLGYFQSHGQTPQERINALKRAAALARVEVVFRIEDGQIVPYYPSFSHWVEFRRELETCFPLGQFEWEVAAVQGVIQNYYNRFD